MVSCHKLYDAVFEYFGPKEEPMKVTPAIKKHTEHKTPLLYSLS